MLSRTGETLHFAATGAAGIDTGLGMAVAYSSSGATHVGAGISNPRNRDASFAKRGGSSVTQHRNVPAEARDVLIASRVVLRVRMVVAFAQASD